MSITLRNIDSNLDAFLNPKLHQVIGTTPESLRANLEQSSIGGRKESGMKFIAVSIFAAAVNKVVASEFFAEGAFKDMRDALGDKVLLNGSINMTSLTLAGHCFLTNDRIARSKFAAELRKKMGASTIWGVGESGGNLSEKQRTIYRQKAGKTTLAAAEDFCTWFLGFVGITTAAAPPTGGVALTSVPESSAAESVVSTTRRGKAREPTDTELAAFTWELPAEGGLRDYYYKEKGRTRADLWKLYTEKGASDTVKRVRDNMSKDHAAPTEAEEAI